MDVINYKAVIFAVSQVFPDNYCAHQYKMEKVMAKFHSIRDFVGTYRGNYDGRNAEVMIIEGAEGLVSYKHLLTVTFTELDRQETYKGVATLPEAAITHILSDFHLDSVTGNRVYWRRLFLHTWDISYLSGVSVWNNTEYGMSFRRIQ